LHILSFGIDNCLINGTLIYYDSYDSLRSKQIIIILKDQRTISFTLQEAV